MSGKFASQRVEKLQGECENWREIGQKDNPDFANSWVNFSSTFESAGFYKDKFNRVWLKGLIKDGIVDGTPPFSPAFTLPEGYRPSNRLVFSSVDGSGTPAARVDITSDGEVAVMVGNNSFITLEGLSWRV